MKKTEDETGREERRALIREIESRIREMAVEPLRRVDWYIDRIER